MSGEPLSTRMIWQVNSLFCDLYQRFQNGEEEVIVDSQESGDTGKFSVWPYGNITFARIRRNLVSMDLLAETHVKLPAENGKTKSRLAVRPTSKGALAYRDGLIIHVFDGVDPDGISVGLGRLYANIETLHRFFLDMVNRSNRRVAQYRLEDWEMEFLDLIRHLAHMLHGEAEVKVRTWTTTRLESLPLRKTSRIFGSIDGKSRRLEEFA